jgi:hypothetical protein
VVTNKEEDKQKSQKYSPKVSEDIDLRYLPDSGLSKNK